MPFSPISGLYDDELPDVNSIPQFVTVVQELLDDITTRFSPILFPGAYRRMLMDAWQNTRESIAGIRAAYDDLSSDIKRQIGLLENSASLDLKLKGFNDAWKRFRKHGTVKHLRRLLEWINLILGSLASAIPQVEGVKEIKEVIEKLLEPPEN